MMQQEMVDLSDPSPDQQVASLRYFDRNFHVTNGEGDRIDFPEFNLRFKVDGSDIGPLSGTPALIPSGMMGDRAFIVFAAPGGGQRIHRE